MLGTGIESHVKMSDAHMRNSSKAFNESPNDAHSRLASATERLRQSLKPNGAISASEYGKVLTIPNRVHR